MVPDTLEKRVERLEEWQIKQDENYTKIMETLAELKTLIKQPHQCKWDNTVPVLVEFKNNTTPIRDNIFKRLDKNDDEIDVLKEDMSLVKQNNRLLKGLITSLENKDDLKKQNNFTLKQGIILAGLSGAIALIIGFVFRLIDLIS